MRKCNICYDDSFPIPGTVQFRFKAPKKQIGNYTLDENPILEVKGYFCVGCGRVEFKVPKEEMEGFREILKNV